MHLKDVLNNFPCANLHSNDVNVQTMIHSNNTTLGFTKLCILKNFYKEKKKYKIKVNLLQRFTDIH